MNIFAITTAPAVEEATQLTAAPVEPGFNMALADAEAAIPLAAPPGAPPGPEPPPDLLAMLEEGVAIQEPNAQSQTPDFSLAETQTTPETPVQNGPVEDLAFEAMAWMATASVACAFSNPVVPQPQSRPEICFDGTGGTPPICLDGTGSGATLNSAAVTSVTDELPVQNPTPEAKPAQVPKIALDQEAVLGPIKVEAEKQTTPVYVGKGQDNDSLLRKIRKENGREVVGVHPVPESTEAAEVVQTSTTAVAAASEVNTEAKPERKKNGVKDISPAFGRKLDLEQPVAHKKEIKTNVETPVQLGPPDRVESQGSPVKQAVDGLVTEFRGQVAKAEGELKEFFGNIIEEVVEGIESVLPEGVNISVKASTGNVKVQAEAPLSSTDTTLVIKQITDRLEMLAATRPKEGVTIHLNPHNLGTVTLVVKSVGQMIDTQIFASDEKVKEALERTRPELIQAMDARGYQVQNVSVSQQTSHGTQYDGKGQPQQGNQSQTGGDAPRQNPQGQHHVPAHAMALGHTRAAEATPRFATRGARGVDLSI